MKWFTGKCGNDIQYGHIFAQAQIGIFNFNLGALKKNTKKTTSSNILCKFLNQNPAVVMWILGEVGSASFAVLM